MGEFSWFQSTEISKKQLQVSFSSALMTRLLYGKYFKGMAAPGGCFMVRQLAFLSSIHSCATFQPSTGVEDFNFPIISKMLLSNFILRHIYDGLL